MRSACLALIVGVVALGVLRRGRLSLALAVGCLIAGTALALIAGYPRPGDFFGEIAPLRDTPRTATVYATQPGLLYALEREAFVASVTNNPCSAIAADDVIEARLAPV